MNKLARFDAIRANFELIRNELHRRHPGRWIGFYGTGLTDYFVALGQGYEAQNEEARRFGHDPSNIQWFKITPRGTQVATNGDLILPPTTEPS